MYTAFVLLISLGLVTSAGAEPSGLLITCDAPAAYLGERGTVICNYHTDLTAIGIVYLSVDHYRPGTNDPDEVAACTNVNSEGLTCENKLNGYTFKLTEKTDTMQLEIAETAVDHTGRYACKLISPSIERTQPQPCQLSLQDPSATTPTTEDKHSPPDTKVPSASDGIGWESILGIVVGVAVLAAIVSLLFFFWRRRVAGQRNKKPDDGHPADDNGDTAISIEEPFPKQASPLPTPVWVRTNPKHGENQERQPLISAAQNDSETLEDIPKGGDNSKQKDAGFLGLLGSTENLHIVVPDIMQTSEHIEEAGNTSPVQKSHQFTGPHSPVAQDTFPPSEDGDELEEAWPANTPESPQMSPSVSTERLDEMVGKGIMREITDKSINPTNLRLAKDRLRKTDHTLSFLENGKQGSQHSAF